MTLAGCMIVAALLAGGPQPVDLEVLVQRYGLQRVTDAAIGRETLRGLGVTLVIAPGLDLALWNGEARQLSCPVAIVGGRVVVSSEVEQYFAGRAVAPRPTTPAISEPVTKVRTSRGFTLVLDAGHGGRHTGGKGPSGLLEKEVNLDVALRLQRLLVDYGIHVVMTRTTDTHFAPDVDDDLRRRIEIANAARANFFMSIHSNWVPNTLPRGWEIYVPRSLERTRMGSLVMAREVEALFRKHLNTEDRGIKEAGYRVLRGTTAPAVLVELEFLSNPQGERELGDPAHRQKLATLLFEAIKRYVERAP